MKIVKHLILVLSVVGISLTTGCRAFNSLFPSDNDPGAINTEGYLPLAQDESLNAGPGLGAGPELAQTEWMDVDQFDDATRSADDWEPIPGKLGFPTIYFGYNQDRVGSSERSKLDSVADYMKQYTSVGLIIEGHCDERGSDEFNRVLGERRAIAVKDYMISAGIPESRLKTISFVE